MKKIIIILLLTTSFAKAQDSINALRTISVGQNANISDIVNTAYEWSTGETTQSINVSPPVTTSYTVTRITNGITASASVTINVLPNSFDSSSLVYFSKAGITDSAERLAVDIFIKAVKSSGFWNKIYMLNLISPTCYGAAMNSIVGNGLTHLSDPNYSKTGLYFNGYNQALKTGVIPSNLNYSNFTFLIRKRNSTGAGGIDFGCQQVSTTQSFYFYCYLSNQARIGAYGSSSVFNFPNTNSTGNYFFTTYSTISKETRKNKLSLGVNTAAISGTQPTIEMYLGGDNGNPSIIVPSLVEISSVAVFSTALTISEENILSDLLDTYNNTVISGGR